MSPPNKEAAPTTAAVGFCSLCGVRSGAWTSPTGHAICIGCIIETLRADLAYWRDLAYKLYEELDGLYEVAA